MDVYQLTNDTAWHIAPLQELLRNNRCCRRRRTNRFHPHNMIAAAREKSVTHDTRRGRKCTSIISTLASYFSSFIFFPRDK
jgi:hypothetical protein